MVEMEYSEKLAKFLFYLLTREDVSIKQVVDAFKQTREHMDKFGNIFCDNKELENVCKGYAERILE